MAAPPHAPEAAPRPGTAFHLPPPPGPSRRAAFLDRDGVINIDHGYTSRVADFAFVPGVLAGCAALHALGYLLVVVTNQSGIGRGRYTADDFLALTDWMRGRFEDAGAPLAGVYFCPHHPQEAVGAFRVDCACRKPGPAMLTTAIHDLRLDPARSVMFGDKASDLQAARAAGVALGVLLAHNGVDGQLDPKALALSPFRYTTLADALADPALRAVLPA